MEITISKIDNIMLDARRGMRTLADLHGWDLSKNGLEPLPPVQLFHAAGYTSLAQIAVAAGCFSSIKDAKRNGWDRPVVRGTYTVARKKFKVVA